MKWSEEFVVLLVELWKFLGFVFVVFCSWFFLCVIFFNWWGVIDLDISRHLLRERRSEWLFVCLHYRMMLGFVVRCNNSFFLINYSLKNKCFKIKNITSNFRFRSCITKNIFFYLSQVMCSRKKNHLKCIILSLENGLWSFDKCFSCNVFNFQKFFGI